MMRNTKSKILICGGLLLIAAALCLAGYNLWDAHRAAGSVESLIRDMEELTAAEPPEVNVPDDSASLEQELPEEAEIPAYILDPTMDMPTVELDGNEYIGTLEIPSLELSLPVMSGWSYPKLKIAPCRYEGSAYLNDLIIAAHNYAAHFGSLVNLEQGDSVVFTDAGGNRFSYTVSEIEQISGAALEELLGGDWDLTLFTCTVGGKDRVTVRCDREEAETDHERGGR